MKKLVYLIVAIAVLALIVPGCIPVVPPSEQNELGSIISKTGEIDEYTHNTVDNGHKIRNKWDLKGSFISHDGYRWGDLTGGDTWQYSIHIKEAMNGDFSVGSIHFSTGEINVIGIVEQTKSDYDYWPTPNLAAAGRVEYGGVTYNFLFLYCDIGIWFAISQAELEPSWSQETVWSWPEREYQLHSLNPGTIIIWGPKEIH